MMMWFRGRQRSALAMQWSCASSQVKSALGWPAYKPCGATNGQMALPACGPVAGCTSGQRLSAAAQPCDHMEAIPE